MFYKFDWGIARFLQDRRVRMKVYKKPKIEITLLNLNDVILSSGNVSINANGSLHFTSDIPSVL